MDLNGKMKLNKIVLLTGFDPFGEFDVNPSWEVARRINNQEISDFTIRSIQVPLKYNEIKSVIVKSIETLKPKIIISLGQSYRNLISLEKVAINFADLTESNVLYNCGSRPKDQILEPNGQIAYFTNLPLRRILSTLRQNNIPSEISYTAGTFGCNQIFYQTMHQVHQTRLPIKAGFIHVPCLPSQAAKLQKMNKGKIPSMDLNIIVEALKLIIKETIANL
jgi:pyroglutamyl-peptidase